MRLPVAILAVLAVACSEPARLPGEAEVAGVLRSSDRLYTTEYVVRKIVTFDDVKSLSGRVFGRDFDLQLPLGSRKIAIPMDARLKAYIDFSEFSPADVVITEGEPRRLRVTLPAPQVVLTSTSIDHEGVREYTGAMRSRFSDAEMARFEQQGRAVILASASALGIEETAKRQAVESLLPLFVPLGFAPEDVYIEFRPGRPAVINQAGGL